MVKSVLIVGLGQIGMMYDYPDIKSATVFSHAKAFFLHEKFNLIGAVDFDPTRASLFEKIFRKPGFENLHHALDETSPEVVVIATPTDTHHDILNLVLAYGSVKYILCEKPLAFELEDGDAMVAKCKKRGVKLYVNYMRRTDPGVGEIRKRLLDGRIGSPIKGFCWYSKGLLNNGSHFFNLLEYWLGRPLNHRVIEHNRFWDGKDPELDFFVTYERGSVVFRSVWEEAFSHYTIELLSPSGRLRYEKGGADIIWQGLSVDAYLPGYKILQEDSERIFNGMDKYQWHAVDCLSKEIDGFESTLCTGEEALHTLRYLKKISHH